ISVPDAKALSPAPWNMSTLIERSLLACSHICASRSYIAKVKALRACGRLNVARPIPSFTSNRRSLAPVDCSSMRFWSCGRVRNAKGNLNADMRESKPGRLAGGYVWASTRGLPPHLGDRAAHGLDDVLIAGAAAQIGRQKIENIVVREVGVGLQRIHGQHQETRGAEPALKRVVLDECTLHGMQLIAIGEAFDRANALALGLDREHQAGSDRLVIEDHGTCPAYAVLTPDMRAGQSTFVTDDIDKCPSRLDPNGIVMAVDVELELELVTHRMHSVASKAEARAIRAAAD